MRPPSAKGLKDVDLAARTRLLKAMVYGGGGGGFLGLLAGALLGHPFAYSRAETLAVRGHYDDAIAVYQEAIDEVPLDPEPYLRIGRLLRDKVNDPEEAAVWFRRALQEAELRGQWEIVLVRELAELYRHRIGAPARAAPLLARIAERYEGSPEGEWAREELADVRSLMAEDTE